MKRILLLTAIICAYGINTTFAQTNLNLEAWSAAGCGAEDPDGWATLNIFTCLAFPQSTFKETADPGEGTFSARLETILAPGATSQGACSDTSGGMLSIGTETPGGNIGIPYTQRPVSVDFLYKYLPVDSDIGAMIVTLTAQGVTVGQGLMIFGGQVPTWTLGSICITYFSADTPDTLAIIASSSAVMFCTSLGMGIGAQRAGTVLFLDSFAINLPGALNIQITGLTNANCNGDCNGVVSIDTIGGGTSPFTYSWSSGGNTDTETGLCAGMYTVFVTDGNGDKACLLAPISEPAMALTATVNSTNETSAGANDGTADASASGGTSPYTYSWNTTPVQTTASISGLAPADYIVTVTDTNGCTFMDTVAVGAFTGIRGIDENANIKVYPNPAVNELNIVTAFNGKAVFDIFDIVGRQIKSVAIRGDNTRVDIAEFPEGMYLYQIIDDKGAVLSKGKFNIVR